MKFLYFTDPHGRANNPISRLDDFPSTILAKIEWAIDYANKHNAYVLCGGDWLNRPDTSPNYIGALAKILVSAKKLPIYTVLGNHDVYGYNASTFSRTPLHILEEIGVIQVLTEEPILLGDVTLSGASASYDLDKQDKSHYLMIDKEKLGEGPWIHIVHGFLAKNKWGDFVEHTTIDEIKDAHPDIILSGHEHSGFGIVEKYGKIFCNPGALARVTAGVGDVNMTVSVLMIDTDKDEMLSLVKCPLAKPAEEVIDREKLLKEKEHAEKMQKFFTSVSDIDLSMIDSSDIFKIFDEFCKTESVDDKVRDIILKYLAVADERIKHENTEGW